jgi:predicted permease
MKIGLFSVCSVLVIFFLGIPVSMVLSKDKQKRGVILQAIFRSNFILFAIPIVQPMYGREIAVTVFLIMIIIPILNILSVFALEIFRDGKIQIRSILFNICINPLIIASMLGIFFSVWRMEIPRILLKSIKDISLSATPIALIVLGGSFQKYSLKKNIGILMSIAAVKLLVIPTIFLTISVLLGLRNVELLSLLPLFGSPTAVSTFSMVQQMGGDSELAAQNILFTTIFSAFTIFMWISVLNFLGLI